MLSVQNCTATLQHLIAASLAPSRGVAAAELLEDLRQNDDLRNGAAALDSLDQLTVVRDIAEFFELEKAGIEQFLLRRTRLSQWSEMIVASLDEGTLTDLWFRSGGTTGSPKLAPQAVTRLLAEVGEIASLVAGTRRIISLVPFQHIYGFLWGPLLSDHLQVPLVHGEEAVKTVHKGLGSGDLVLGIPEWWSYFGSRHHRFPNGVRGVTSTAPCPPQVIATAIEKGLTTMIEVYGSSETAGIGWRDDPELGFRLFQHWKRFDNDHLESRDGIVHALPDAVDWEADDLLIPLRRRDDAVQVGGVNVWPDRVRISIEGHPGVLACAVRPFDTGNGTRLKAFIVPSTVPSGEEHPQLREWLKSNLSVPERPVQLAFGDSLPRNSMGKLCDW